MRRPPGKTATEVRKEAARYARAWARERDLCGDPEGSECFRILAREIEGIRIKWERSPRPISPTTPGGAS